VTEIQPEIDLTEIDTKRSVSRRHARMTLRDGAWYVAEEVGALNGTFVNGTRLLPGRGAPLSPGDIVSAGMVRLIFRLE
jgi:pSer/pThr/pTyr-binding forkhead associated (FHA) protein